MALRRSLLAALLAASALFVGTVGSVTATEPTTTPVTCDGHWPAATQGVPSTWKAGAVAGTYIWHDATGLHLRVTHRGTAKLVFAGKIVSTGDARPGGPSRGLRLRRPERRSQDDHLPGVELRRASMG